MALILCLSMALTSCQAAVQENVQPEREGESVQVTVFNFVRAETDMTLDRYVNRVHSGSCFTSGSPFRLRDRTSFG